jgi:hypothetical protein
LVSPLFMLFLFYGQAMGFVTDSASMIMAKYGNDPAYLEYIATTPIIFPGA